MNKRFTIEKKLIVQVRYYEELYKIRDIKGEAVFVGSEAMARKFLKLLNGEPVKRRKRK